MKKKFTTKQIIEFCEDAIAFEKRRIKSSKKTIAECKELIANAKGWEMLRFYKKKK